LSFKIQIALFVIILVAGLVYSFYWTVSETEKKSIMSEVVQKVVLQARNIALSSSKPLLHEDPEFVLHPLITRIFSLMNGEELLENDSIIEVRVPITEQGERIGTVYLKYSKAAVTRAIAEAGRRLLKMSIFALLVGALVSFLLAHHITKPIKALTVGAEKIGQGELDTKISVHSVREIQLLADTFNEMVEKLKEGRSALLEKERMHKELEIARTIQATLLPSKLPHLRNFELDAYYNPASEVGGDYFDLIKIDDRRIMIVVGDVAGKGVPGLVVMAMVRILVRSLARRRENPASLLRHLNVMLLKDMKKNLFVTLFIGILDTQDSILEFASAAHMPLLVFHCKEKIVRMIKTSMKPLGIFPGETCSCSLRTV